MTVSRPAAGSGIGLMLMPVSSPIPPCSPVPPYTTHGGKVPPALSPPEKRHGRWPIHPNGTDARYSSASWDPNRARQRTPIRAPHGPTRQPALHRLDATDESTCCPGKMTRIGCVIAGKNERIAVRGSRRCQEQAEIESLRLRRYRHAIHQHQRRRIVVKPDRALALCRKRAKEKPNEHCESEFHGWHRVTPGNSPVNMKKPRTWRAGSVHLKYIAYFFFNASSFAMNDLGPLGS